jgi:hypothetical protein
MELRDVREPLLVGRGSMEIAIDDVIRGGDLFPQRKERYLRRLGLARLKALLLHKAPHDLLRDKHPLPVQRRLNTTITIGPVIAFKYLGHGVTDFCILVGNPHRRPMVEVGTARQVEPDKKIS